LVPLVVELILLFCIPPLADFGDSWPGKLLLYRARPADEMLYCEIPEILLVNYKNAFLSIYYPNALGAWYSPGPGVYAFVVSKTLLG